MLGLRPLLIALALSGLAGCGARSPLDGGGGGALAAGGLADGGVVLPDGAVVPAALCRSWVTTHAPVQVSNTPSSVELMSALATPTGVLVGYADEQFPPVDSSWHLRSVAFGEGALGSEQTPFHRNSSQLGWTRISTAQRGGEGAATASDQVQGMLFSAVDSNGAPTGKLVHAGGDPARFLLPTSSGFSVLRSAFDESGLLPPPVQLATLDPSGNVLATKTVQDATTKSDWYLRTAFSDGSFLLVWIDDSQCGGCRVVHAQHLTEAGDPLASPVVLHTFDANHFGDYAVAPSSRGFLFAWSDGSAPIDLFGEPFDADGNPSGGSNRFAELPAANAVFTLASAPGGDLLAAWADGLDSQTAALSVLAVNADGSPEGPQTTVGPINAQAAGLGLLAVASPLGAMVLYESDLPNYGVEVFAAPLRCADGG